MLTIRKLKKTLGGRTLFEEADMQVNYGERVALVGPNGAGKSTLFSLLLKKDEPDAGSIERDEWTMIGHLAQEGEATGEESVLDVATGRASELPALEQRLKELEEAGTSFNHVLADYRSRLARRLLARTDESIEQIVYLTGFAEPSTFYRAFKRWTHETPIEYRKRKQEQSARERQEQVQQQQ